MKLDIKKLIFIALCVAIFVVLSIYGTINLSGLKLTIQNLPIYVAAITFGPVSGALVGFVGTLIYQMISYGFQVTTFIWVLPQTILGVVCGILFKNEKLREFRGIRFYVTIISLNVFLTALNTIALTIDALVMGYYSPLIIFGTLIIRLMSSVLVGILYCILIPIIEKSIKKIH